MEPLDFKTRQSSSCEKGKSNHRLSLLVFWSVGLAAVKILSVGDGGGGEVVGFFRRVGSVVMLSMLLQFSQAALVFLKLSLLTSKTRREPQRLCGRTTPSTIGKIQATSTRKRNGHHEKRAIWQSRKLHHRMRADSELSPLQPHSSMYNHEAR